MWNKHLVLQLHGYLPTTTVAGENLIVCHLPYSRHFQEPNTNTQHLTYTK